MTADASKLHQVSRLAGWLNFTKLDLRTLAPYTRTIVLTMMVLSVAAFLAANTVSAIQMVVGLGLLMIVPSHLFASDENAHLDLLYGLLPLSRSSVVIGRYATVLITVGVSLLIGALIAATGVLVKDLPAEGLGITAIYLASAMLVLQGVQTPLYFKFGYAKARMLNMALLVATAIGFFTLLTFVTPGENASTARIGLLPLGCLTGGSALFAVSTAVSVRFYRSREF